MIIVSKRNTNVQRSKPSTFKIDRFLYDLINNLIKRNSGIYSIVRLRQACCYHFIAIIVLIHNFSYINLLDSHRSHV